MSEYQTYSLTAEVNGRSILSFVKGMPDNEDIAFSILADNGITDIEDDKWYSQQAWLKSFKEIAEKIGSKTLRCIGSKIIESAKFPCCINSVGSALASLDQAYHMNHRINGKVLFDHETGTMLEGIGHYKFKKLGENEFRIICENPYPCDFDKGVIKGTVEKFLLPNQKAEYYKDSKSGCRKKSSSKCTFHIKIVNK